MRHFSSLVIAFVLASSGSVLAQQQLLIRHNDANDPCARFKMRILIPAYVADHKLPVKEFTEGNDSKMVWESLCQGEATTGLWASACHKRCAIPKVTFFFPAWTKPNEQARQSLFYSAHFNFSIHLAAAKKSMTDLFCEPQPS